DRVDIPLGFGAFQAEDFTRWNGGANAPQVQILEEALKAKLEGRDVDGGAVARKRRRLMSRIRIVSVLTVLALTVAIAWGVNDIVRPDPPPTDLRAELLRLLAEGQLTPEQAIQLAEILEAGALGETQSAALEAPSASAEGRSTMPMSAEAEPSMVSEAAFDATARESYRQAFLALSQHQNPQVRVAVAQMSQDSTRQAAMQTLWTYARDNPDDP